ARPLPAAAERPLSGIRVLDLTRVIAGPVCGRTLAAHGADVMRITAPHLPGLPMLDIDTGRGKLSAALDLRSPDDRERLAGLLREAHVFVQAIGPAASPPWASRRRPAPRSGPASSQSRSPPTAARAPGLRGAASTRSCRT